VKGPQSFSASVRVQGTATASEYVKDNYIILIVRSPDNTVDVHTDKIIDKSRTFQIPIGTATATIEVPLGQNTLARLHQNQLLDFYLCILPKRSAEPEVLTLQEIELRGGRVLEYKGMQGVFSNLSSP
jgi:hypothetical protein